MWRQEEDTQVGGTGGLELDMLESRVGGAESPSENLKGCWGMGATRFRGQLGRVDKAFP